MKFNAKKEILVSLASTGRLLIARFAFADGKPLTRFPMETPAVRQHRSPSPHE